MPVVGKMQDGYNSKMEILHNGNTYANIIYMKTSTLSLSKDQIDDVLFNALLAVYRFERQKINSFGLDYTSILALQLLRRNNPQRMKDLVDALGMPFSSTTRLFGKLEESGYVKRIYAQEDKRGVHVYLTESGEEVVEKIEDHTFRVISETSKLFDSKTLNHFVETAKNMGRILDVEYLPPSNDKQHH